MNNLGLKAPRGWGCITNPRKASYNRDYNRTTRGCLVALLVWGGNTTSAVMAVVQRNVIGGNAHGKTKAR